MALIVRRKLTQKEADKINEMLGMSGQSGLAGHSADVIIPDEHGMSSLPADEIGPTGVSYSTGATGPVGIPSPVVYATGMPAESPALRMRRLQEEKKRLDAEMRRLNDESKKLLDDVRKAKEEAKPKRKFRFDVNKGE